MVLLLPACSSLSINPVSSWEQHQSRVQALDSWQLGGRLNIRTETASDTINLLWDQREDLYEINLNGPLGMGSVRINSTGSYIVIEKSGEEPLYTRNLADISVDYLGYEFPADELYYWIRGIPAPDSDSTVTLNDDRLLATLSQGPWQLEYDRYQAHEGLNLPGRIRMEHPPYRLTFLINRWEFD